MLRCQRYHTDKHKISCVHVHECIGYTELRPNAASLSANFCQALPQFTFRPLRGCLGTLRHPCVSLGCDRELADVMLTWCSQCTRPVESCQMGCHPVLGKQDEQDHESIQNIFHRRSGTGTGTFRSAVKAKSSL